MTRPTLIVEIGFTAPGTGAALHLDDPVRGKLGTATLAADGLFTDLSSRVVSVTTKRGASRADGPVLRYEAGTATIVLRNDDRALDPTNLEGPFVAAGVSQVEPMRAVRLRASYGGVTWPLWRGFTDEWTVAYDGPNSSYATVTCFDAFGVFAAYDRTAVAAIGAGELTGARINRILDSVSWPTTDRMVDAGEETVQATTLDGNALSELLLTADTELGEFWIDADGRARFRARSASYTATRSAHPLAGFGDQPNYTETTTVNLATNPSLETTTASWSTGGSVAPSIARSSTRAAFGSWSLLATWGTGGFLPNVRYDLSGLTIGKQYAVSVYIWVPLGSLPITIVGQGAFGGTTSTFDQWERISWTGSATDTSLAVGLWPVGSPAGGETFYIDGLQIEQSTTVSTYVDGSQPDGLWDGIPHASISRRLAELDYGDLTLTYDALSITNQVTAARVGGVEQTVSDAVSVSAYLTRSHQRTDLLMQTDPEAKAWGEQVLARRSMPELRVAELELKPARDPDRLWAEALGREIGDRIRVVRRPPGGGEPIVRDAWVRGIEHDLGKSLDWRSTFVLEQARDVITVADTFTRTVSAGWGTADTGETWTIEITSGGSTTSGMRIGMDAPLGTEWTNAVANYPGISYTRDFGRDNVWGTDADTLTEPTKYGTGKFVALPAGAVMHLSWKDDPNLLTNFLNDLPTLPANHPGFYISPWHEPRDEVSAGDFTTATFRSWGATLSNIKATHPRGSLIKGVGPILTRYDLDDLNTDPTLYGWSGMDFFGIDCYWQGTSSYPTTAQMFDVAFNKVRTAYPTVRILVPEYGMLRTTADTTGSGRASTITTHINYLKSLGYVDAVAYFNAPGAIPGVEFSSTSPEADAWRALQASQGGTTGAGGTSADYSTTGTKGRLSIGSVNVYRRAWIPVGVANLDVYAAGLTCSATPTGASIESQVAARFDGTSFVGVRVVRRTSNDVQIAVRQVVGGSESAASSLVTVSSATATSTLDVRLQAVGSTVRARAWVSGTSEPTTWTVSTTVTFLTAGDVRVSAIANTGNTNTLPVTVDVDSVTATALHTWT